MSTLIHNEEVNTRPEPKSLQFCSGYGVCLNPRAKQAGLPHRSRLNVACGAGRMAETNDSSPRWGPWAELGLASGAAPGLRCWLEPAGQEGPGRGGDGERRDGRARSPRLMGPRATRLDLAGPAHSLPAG